VTSGQFYLDEGETGSNGHQLQIRSPIVHRISSADISMNKEKWLQILHISIALTTCVVSLGSKAVLGRSAFDSIIPA
jgi:hypothetical protein